MANHPSAKKRNRQRVKRAARNQHAIRSVRTAVKAARLALAAGDPNAAQSVVTEASRALARAGSKGVVHSRTASRTASRIQSKLHKLATG